jgi:hypothetical protein
LAYIFLDSRFLYASNVRTSKASWSGPFLQLTCTKTAGPARSPPSFVLRCFALTYNPVVPSNLVSSPKPRIRFSRTLKLLFLLSSLPSEVAGITCKALASSPPKVLLYQFGRANLALKKARAGTAFNPKTGWAETTRKRWMWKLHIQRKEPNRLAKRLFIQERERVAAYRLPSPINEYSPIYIKALMR